MTYKSVSREVGRLFLIVVEVCKLLADKPVCRPITTSTDLRVIDLPRNANGRS